MAALDLLTHAAADGVPHRFRQASEEDLAPFLDRVKDSALKHALSYGVGYLHEAQDPEESSLVKTLFSSGAVQVLVGTGPCAWGLSCAARAVVVMGTQYYDITGQGTNDYSVTDLLQMVGRAGRPGIDAAATCVLMCHAPRKEYYKKFLFEPLPVESHLDAALHDAMAAEIVTRTVQNKQDAVDYLTWTFYYRRLTQNPNYYNMTGVSHRHVSDHLSELVESVLSDLETSKVISIEDDFDLEPLNLGMIAAYYYVSYTTIELFAASLAAKTKLKGLVEILSAASEYDEIPVRPGEERTVEKTLAHAPLALERPRYTDPHTKVNALIQAHLSRSGLNPDLSSDAKLIIAAAPRLLQAMVDVVSSSGWLNPALATMELSQMITQGLWQRDPVLMQIPGVAREVAAAATANGVETIFDVAEMEEDARRENLQLDGPQLEVANAWLARYPDIGVDYKIVDPENIVAGEPVTVTVSLEREGEGDIRPVDAPRFPGRKDENWWLVVGDPGSNSLLAIKRIALQRKAKAKLEFAAPADAGKKELTLFLMCDSYMGCDQEFELELNVAPGEEGAAGDDAEAMAVDE
jgi:pre-mRNA-splicing helicase BRR2